MKKVVAIILAVAIILGAGGYVGNMMGYFNKGNASEYSVKNSRVAPSKLNDMTIIFLGSSVTYGYASKGESFVDFMEKQDKITAIKKAKSGTTLVDDSKSSYISRMKKIDKDIKVNAFVCQLSTNDATKSKPLGKIEKSYIKEDFDTHTVAGAMEYIIAYAEETWGCPVIFYTNTKYDSESYEKMVELTYQIQEKWHCGVIDLWNYEELNNFTAEEQALYMNDKIHPTRAGYKLWTPVIRRGIESALGL